MRFYIFTGSEVRDKMLSALAGRSPSADTVCTLPTESTFKETCTVTSLSVLDAGMMPLRSEYLVVLYGDGAYLSSGRHSDFQVEYGEKYSAVSLPLSVDALLCVFEKMLVKKADTAEEDHKLVYDRGAGLLFCKDKTEVLTKLESELYELFLKSGDAPLSKETIRRELWGEACRSNAPDVYVSYLRRKLDRLTGEGSITSIRGVGYKLNR